MSVNIDQYSRIIHKGIHDAQLRELHYIVGDKFEISLSDELNNNHRLSLRPIYKIGISNFIEGNIISHIFLWTIGGEVLEKITNGDVWRVLYEQNYDSKTISEISSRDKSNHSGRFLVFLECSYGCSIAAICDEVSIW